MATAAQFAATPKLYIGGALTAANTALDGTGATGRTQVFEGGVNGSVLDKVIVRHKGTNVQTVVRIFINNGSTPETAGNNSLVAEKTIAANTLSQTAESTHFEIPLNLPIPAGYDVYATIGTAVSAGLQFTGVGGDL